MLNRKSPLLFILFAGMVALTGCGDDKRPPTFDVTGKVMYKKKTIPVGATVVFHPTDPAVEKKLGGKPRGTVGEDGSYTLTMFKLADGSPEGEFGVTIDWRAKPKDNGKASMFGDAGAQRKALLNPKYGNPANPAFKVTVKKGQKNEFNFEVD